MIKTLTAYTHEVDDLEEAIASVLDQLDIEHNLLANAVGIVACHYEFFYSGAAKAICEALPFDVVGATTISQALPGISDEMMFSIMVLTSDTDTFTTCLTDKTTGDPEGAICTAYQHVANQLKTKPSLALMYAPLVRGDSGDGYVSAFTEVSGGVACFGTLAIDDTDELAHCYMLFNGEHYNDRIGLVLIHTDATPHFFIATISESKIMKKTALITKSVGNLLMEVNGNPVDQYFSDLGLAGARAGQYDMAALPFLLDYGDGTPKVSKVFVAHTPEKYAVCAGLIPEGATMYVGVFDKEDVLYTTGKAIDEALEVIEGASCILGFCCVARSISLGVDNMAEMELIRDKVGDKLPFMAISSGGEICPTQISNARAINRFHNNAFIICVL